MARTMKLVRVSDGLLISDFVEYAAELDRMQLNQLQTSNNRTYIQPWGGLEHGFDITLQFSSRLPNSNLVKRRAFVRSAWRKDRLRLYYRDGQTYPVEIAEYEQEKDEESKVEQIYHIDAVLIRKDADGWET